MIKFRNINIVVFLLFMTKFSHADIIIKSPNDGFVVFSQQKKGENYDKDAWGKVTFSNYNIQYEVGRSDRYYVENGNSKVSPSGRYLILKGISGDEVTQEDGTKKYTDRAYCSVIDLRNGCIMSDWDGEACSYSWSGNKDVLASSSNPDESYFDFMSTRPTIKGIKDPLSFIKKYDAENILRCDSPSKENINDYQKLLKESSDSKEVIVKAIIGYLNDLTKGSLVKTKAILFSEPNINSKTKAYLVSGDKVKVIKITPNKEWANIGYINTKGMPLVAWVKLESLIEK